MKRLSLGLLLITTGLLLTVMGQTKPAPATDMKSGSVEDTLMKLEHDSMEATKRNDISFFEKLEAPDYLFVDPSGMVHTREEDLAIAKSGDLKFESMTAEDMKVRVYGDVAVVTGITTVKGAYKTQDISGKYRWTDVFVKRNGEWQIVNAQLTPVQTGPPPK
jgi:ketosteroid isomerase-like protein